MTNGLKSGSKHYKTKAKELAVATGGGTSFCPCSGLWRLGMFSWVVKVVPQPPEKPGKLGDEEKNNAAPEATVKEDAKSDNPAKPKEDEVSEENSTQSGVLTWLSHGFSSALPQPVSTPKLGRANSDAKQEENAVSNRAGVINWIVHGLGKVVPQPDDKYKQQTDSQEATEAPKEVPEAQEKPAVHDAKDLADAEPLPQIAVVEVVSDEEPDADGKNLTPSICPLASRATQSRRGDQRRHSGLSRIVPQPVLKPKEETSDAVQSREKDVKTP
ncbi:hypothetical protein MHYP_G00120510 [Metynnis hypsauchen]